MEKLLDATVNQVIIHILSSCSKEFKDENIAQLIAKSKYFEISRSLKPKQSSIV